MQEFKNRWEIQQNWQLVFPFMGSLMLLYSAFKISRLIFDGNAVFISIIVALILFFILLKITLFLFKILDRHWVLSYKWEMIRVFMVFAITGSSSVLIGKPIMNLIGITKENLNPTLYWILFIIIGLVFYQILLVSFGWLFGQFKFFWEFEKKMLRKMGLKRFIDS